MNRKLYFIFFLIVSVALNSCNNDDSIDQNFTGEYVGTFTVKYLNEDTFTNPVTVVFNGENNYKSSGNSDYFPAGGSGTYERGNSTIIFSDINHWTTNFDPNLILGGEYEYSLNGNTLKISAIRSEFGSYTYELTKE